MDGSDIQLAIRRARRSGAKSLDLSLRGLREWPQDVFTLKQLEAVDVSGNELVSLDPGIRQLELLEELNLANNRLDSFPDLGEDALPRLRSLQLEGNPVASRLGPLTVRQLARPPGNAGQTPAQVIRGLLAGVAGGSEASRPGSATGGRQTRPGSAARLGGVGADRDRSPGHDAISRFDPDDVDDGPSEGGGNAGNSAAPSWLQHSKATSGGADVEALQARIQELEAELAAAKGGGGSGGADSSKPSWLQQDSKTSSMAATLPSRRGNSGLGLGMGLDDGEADGLKTQLKEEQRKSKRLEQDVQRLTSRLQEREMQKQNVGSVPHFEFAEVEMGDMINQGGFSVVHKGRWHKTQVAVKKLFDPKIDQALLDEFDNEVQKLEQLRHPNILLLMGVHRKPPALSIITELVEGGSFYQLLHTPAQFNSASGPVELDVRKTMEILERSGTALAFLHGRGMAHRDIKSQNVLLSPTLEVKLCDFGLARMKSELMTGAMQFAGTPNYMAPEIFRNEKYSENVDVWAFGIMMWEAMAVDIPFANLDAPEIRDKVCRGQMLQMPATTPSAVQSIIKACWTADRNARPPMSDVVSRLQDSLADICAAGRGSSRVQRPRTAHASLGSRPDDVGGVQSTMAAGAPRRPLPTGVP